MTSETSQGVPEPPQVVPVPAEEAFVPEPPQDVPVSAEEAFVPEPPQDVPALSKLI
jgi:hypothetical protein